MNNTIESLGVIKEFSAVDYSVFGGMLAISVLIGVYFGCLKGGQNSVAEYLLGSKAMQTFPITMSLISSLISGVTLLGVPTEVYTYGTQYCMTLLANIAGGLITLFIFLPVFYKLSLLSLYEYLELRFDRSVRVLASLLYTICLLTFTPIVIYGPALALNQVSGMSIHVITMLMCVVCIFYTTLGGLKAVVWTDAVQCIFMIFSMFTVVILGIVRAGGFGAIFQAAEEGGRLEFFNMNPDPKERLSFWTSTVGFTASFSAYVSVNPGSIQRFTALPSFSKAKITVFYLIIGVITFAAPSMFVGLVMYSIYKDCDLLSSGIIKRPDQILPYFVVDVAGHIPGLPGLFVVGICSAALSTMSTTLNSMSGTIYEDFIMPCLPKTTTDARASLIMKVVVVVLGVFCVVMVGFIEKMGAILELTYSFSGVTVGAVFGIFILGVLFPVANAKGSLIGGITSLAFLTWVAVGNKIAMSKGLIHYNAKPISIAGCSFNVTTKLNETLPTEEVWDLYRISVFNYVLFGTLISVVVGLIVSYLTGPLELGRVHPDLLSPLVHRFVPRTSYTMVPLREVQRDNVNGKC